MARNSEKAQAMLNRYLKGKSDEKNGPRAKRPYLATECHDLADADKWRQQILREVGKKVMEIQNAGLGEHRIRDLNDEINKLIREKGHWERRIVELGGPDYSKAAPKVTNQQDASDMGGKAGGYRYFGAAKALPGVKELFEREPPKQIRKTRYQMHKAIDPDYYGFRDEDDGVLLKVEAEAERLMRADAILEWEAQEHTRAAAAGSTLEPDAEAAEQQFVAYVALPDQRQIELKVLEKKKADLLAKYATDEFLSQQDEARSLLNKK
ncbi:hypothetical protein FOA52_010373 [Chlamydomonas sp. UWO 241]|nr:hypothetical protein FOA52_010373 [Chlamydomonas sp. UWO 241]